MQLGGVLKTFGQAYRRHFSTDLAEILQAINYDPNNVRFKPSRRSVQYFDYFLQQNCLQKQFFWEKGPKDLNPGLGILKLL